MFYFITVKIYLLGLAAALTIDLTICDIVIPANEITVILSK